MNHRVAGALQPGLGLLLKSLKVGVGPVRQEVLFHVLDAVLDLALRLGVGRTAEHRPERAASDIGTEHLRHDVVPDVLVPQEHRVLVVDDLPRDAAEVLERLLAGPHRRLGSERTLLEPDVLVAAAAEQHRHEVHLLLRAVTPPQLLLAKVHLSIPPGRVLWEDVLVPLRD